MKDTEQELLDEMIIKDVPETESSTDPVKRFEDSHPPASIESIREDQEETSDTECKDKSLSNLALATNPPHSSHPLPSPSSSDRSPEMLHKEEDKSPLLSGLAAPDSKDSLEVQLTSACEDLSESQISGKGSLDEQKLRQESSESEEEHQPTVNERSASANNSIRLEEDEDAERRTSISDFVLEEDLKIRKGVSEYVFEEDRAEVVQTTGRKIEIVDTDVTTETSDDEFEIVTRKEVEEAKVTVTEQVIVERKDETSTDDEGVVDRRDVTPLAAMVETKIRPDLESIPSTDTEPRQSRPSSSDYSDIYKRRDAEEEEMDSSDEERNTMKASDPRIPSASSDYSDIEDKKHTKEAESVRPTERKSSASSAISDIGEKKPGRVVDSSSEYDQEVVKSDYVRDPQVTQPRKSSVSSDYSDIDDKQPPIKDDRKKNIEAESDSSDSEEETEAVKTSQPRAASASSEEKLVVDSSDFETETIKHVERKSSASSAFSDVAEKRVKPAVVDSSSDYDHDIVKSEYVRDPDTAPPRSVSASSGYSDMAEKKLEKMIEEKAEESSDFEKEAEIVMTKKIVEDESDDSDDEKDEHIIKTNQPRIASASSAYSDVVEKQFEDKTGVDSSDFETETIKPTERMSSASSAYSDLAEKTVKPATDSSSDYDRDIVKPEYVRDSKTAPPRSVSASSDYSDIAEKKQKGKVEEIEIEEESSDFEKEAEIILPKEDKHEKTVGQKKQETEEESDSSDDEKDEDIIKANRPRIHSASSDYSDIAERKVEPVVDSSSDYDHTTVKSKTAPPRSASASSDYSDIAEKKPEVRIGDIEESSDFEKEAEIVTAKQPVTAVSSDYSDVEASKTVTRKHSAPARPSSSDYSDVEVKSDLVTRKYSEVARRPPSGSSDYSDIAEKKAERVDSSDYSDTGEKKVDRGDSSDYEHIGEKKAERMYSSDYEKEPQIIVTSPETFEPGIIQVVVHRAADLINQEIMGKSDPYVMLKFRGQEFRSKTVRNTINPEWNFSTDLLITEVYDSNINIEVFDDDNGLDSCEGILTLSLTDAIKKSDEEGRWYSLTNCKHGRIFVSCIYTAMPSTEAAPRAEAPRVRTYSSSSSDEEVTKDQTTVLQQSSSDSSISNPREKTKIKHQMAMDKASMDDETEAGKRGSIRPQSSSEYSDTDNERKGGRGEESSSDYDSTPARMRKNRPASIVSDTSSDYDSHSNVGSRPRPLSQFLDDEYDIITEEEAAETKSEKKQEADQSSSSESHGPELEDARTTAPVIPPVHLSLLEDQEQDGDHDGTSLPPPPYPHPTHSSSVASTSAAMTSDLHAEAEQTSVSVDLAKTSVINSNTLEEIDPLADDHENVSQSLTKQAEKRNNVTVGGVPQNTSRISSSSCSSLDQAQRDGSSGSERSQGIRIYENDQCILLFEICSQRGNEDELT